MRNHTIGNELVCAWPVGQDVFWVQTRVPAIANVLAKRKSARPVVRGILGGYLKTFAVSISQRRLQGLINRCLSIVGASRRSAAEDAARLSDLENAVEWTQQVHAKRRKAA